MTDIQQSHTYQWLLQQIAGPHVFEERLTPRNTPLPPLLSFTAPNTPAEIAERGALTQAGEASYRMVADQHSIEQAQLFRRNIENYIGTIKVPVGLAGPLRVNGLFAQGDYYVPLATTEAALVASYSRGMQLMSMAGGCSVMVINEGVSRSPGFVLRNLVEVGMFAAWAVQSIRDFAEVAATTTTHGRLSDMRVMIEGNHVYLHFDFTTGDASGQNMVTIATQAICGYIKEHAPVQPTQFFIEANLSGDKKACAKSLLTVRGRKVVAEATLSAELIQRCLHTTPALMADYWRISAMGGILSGSLGVQGQFANGLAAIYLACGQDVACVAESAIGTTRLELTANGELYASVTMPNIMVGTVGGGTNLPSQQACLEMMGLAGAGHARALAEICAATCLAGELSLIGALCADEFARAHAVLARRTKTLRCTQPVLEGCE